MSSDQLTGLINSCVFDLCALEINATMQTQFKCAAYANMANWCSSLLQNTIKWRDATNCRNLLIFLFIIKKSKLFK